MTRAVLTPLGIEVVEALLVALEDFERAIGKVHPDGKAAEILALVQECSGRINDVLEV